MHIVVTVMTVYNKHIQFTAKKNPCQVFFQISFYRTIHEKVAGLYEGGPLGILT